MKKMLFFLLLIHATGAFAEFSGINHVAAGLLTSEDPDLVKLGAKIAENEQVTDTRVLDVAAYQLSQKIGQEQHIDLVSWLAIAIEQSESTRYTAFIQDMMSRAKSDKVKSHLLSAAKSLKNESQGLFTPEGFDIQAVKDKLMKSVSNDLNRDGFKSVKLKDDLNTVIQKMGSEPSGYEDDIVYITRPFVGKLPTQRLVVLYKGLGGFRMDSVKGKYVAEVVYNELSLNSEPGEGSKGEIIRMLAQYKPEIYREGAKRICSENQYSNEVMDVAAMRVWADRNGQDDMVVDGVAWAAKCIGASSNPRYRSFLKQVTKDAGNKKIKKYAEKALAGLLDTDVEQFTVNF